MTTTSIIDERAAVQIAATLDPTQPNYKEAVEVALARRGSRDALIVTLAHQNQWPVVLDVFHDIRSTSVVTNENVDTIYAIAHAVAGSPAIAQAIARNHPDHKMLVFLSQLIERKIPVTEWLARMKALDLETCYRFNN